MTGQALQGSGDVQQLARLGVGVHAFGQAGFGAQGLVQGDAQLGGHQLGYLVHLGVGDVHGPAHVAQHSTSQHGPVGDDLGHMVRAVFLGDVFDHLAPAVVAEVHVDIRHGLALDVQKALKDKFVADGVKVGDAHGIGHQAAGGRAAPRPHGDALVLGPVDEVGHHQEVAGEAHFAQHVQLVGQAVGVFLLVYGLAPLGKLLDALLEALLGNLAQAVFGGLAVGQVEHREPQMPQGYLHLAALGDVHGVGNGLGQLREQVGHLLGRLEIDLARKLHAVWVFHRLAGLDAQQNVVGLVVFAAQVVAVVGGHQAQAQTPRKVDKAGVDLLLLGQACILQLDKEVVFAHDLGQFAGRGLGLVLASGQHQVGHLALQAGAHGDEPLGGAGATAPSRCAACNRSPR